MELRPVRTHAARGEDRLTRGSLQPVDTGLWRVDSHIRMLRLYDVSIRMTVVESGAGLLLYSPVAMGPETLAALERQGTVSAIMAPNLFHHLFLRPAAAAFPRAQVFVPEGLEAKIGPVPNAVVVTPEGPPLLGPELEHFVFDGHRINETVLFHRPTRTLITSDLLYNFQPEHGTVEKALFRLVGGYGTPGLPFYHRFAVQEKAGVRRLIEKVRGWAPRRIVMSHGRIVEDENAGELFARAWAPLG